MSSEELPTAESLSETIAVANAIAMRSGQYEELTERILAHVSGVEYVEQDEYTRQAKHVGRTALLLMTVENPDKVISLTERIDSAMRGEGYAAKAHEISEIAGEEISPDAVRSTIITMGEALNEGAEFSDEFVVEQFKKMLDSAKKVAHKNNTDTATVYLTDEYYYQATREAYTPTEYANIYCRLVDAVSGDLLSKTLVQVMEQVIPQEILEELTSEELAELSAEMQLDQALQEQLSEHAELMKEVVRQVFTHYFARTYGAQAMKDLTAQQELTLMPRRPLAEEAIL